jgi:hypothetical protein
MQVNRGQCGAFMPDTSLLKEEVAPTSAPEVRGYLIGLYRKVARCSEAANGLSRSRKAEWEVGHTETGSHMHKQCEGDMECLLLA